MGMGLTKSSFLCEGKRGTASQFGKCIENIESGLEQHRMEVSINALWFQGDRIFIRTASGEERSWSGFPGFLTLLWQSARNSSYNPLAFIGRN